jgi:pSer/pThr/pTyr-binding forkhead associated (FHA) protein
MARFRLRYAHRNVELPTGQFLIGRSLECHLLLDDPRVSRKHARLLVTDESAYIEDLNSRGGVRVDGLLIKGRHRLSGGSQVTLGDQQLTVVDTLLPEPAPAPAKPATAPTKPEGLLVRPSAALATQVATGVVTPRDEPVCWVDSLRVLGGWASRALAAGRPDEAEAILSARLVRILEVTREAPDAMPVEVVEQAADYAAQLWAAGKVSWVDYAAKLHAAKATPVLLPHDFEVHSPTVGAVNLRALGDYIQSLTKHDDGPAAPDDAPPR